MAKHTIRGVETQVSKVARAIAVKRALIVGVVGFLLSMAVGQGWITPDVSAEVDRWASWILTGASVVGAGAWIARGVTPADPALHPVDKFGNSLVPDITVGPHAGAGDPPLVSSPATGVDVPVVMPPAGDV